MLFKKDWLSRNRVTATAQDASMTGQASDDKNEPRTSGGAVGSESEHSAGNLEFPDENLQEGVAKQEAIALTWNKSTLVLVFVLWVTSANCRCLVTYLFQNVAALLGGCISIFHYWKLDAVRCQQL